MKIQLSKFEPLARKNLVGLIIAAGLLLVGQYTGASAVASAMQQEHMQAWASRSPDHAGAMAEYKRCEVSGTEVTKRGCAVRAAYGAMAAELEVLAATPQAAVDSIPAPLRWFLN